MRLSRARQRRRDHRDRERRRRKHWLVLGISLAASFAITAVAVVLVSPAGVVVRPTAVDPQRAAVLDVLGRIRANWSGRPLDRLLPEELDPRVCEPVLRELLVDPQGPLFAAAVQLTAHLRLEGLAPQLREVLSESTELDAGTGALLADAVEQLEPLAGDELVEMLGSDDEVAVVAAVRIVGQRGQQDLAALVPLLVSPSAEVRAAALAVLPVELAPDVVELLVAEQRDLDLERAAIAVRVLGRCVDVPAAWAALQVRLEQGDEARDVVLAALAGGSGPLPDAARVQAIATAPNLPLRTRALALQVLERAGGIDDVERLLMLWNRHPVLDYLAGRILVRIGTAAGFGLLTEVAAVEPEDFPPDESAAVIEARLGARQILAQVSGLPLTADPGDWIAWRFAHPDIGPVDLPRSTVTFAP